MCEGRRRNPWRGWLAGEGGGGEGKEQDSLPRQRANHTLRLPVRIKGKCKWRSGTFYEYTQTLLCCRQSP